LNIIAGQKRCKNRNRRKCAYCKGPNESKDHSPPKCLLTWPPPPGAKILTLPCCLQCNQSTSRYENLVWIMLALVGRHPVLAQYRAAGGKIDRAFAQDSSLRTAKDQCRNPQGNYQICGEVYTAFDRVSEPPSLKLTPWTCLRAGLSLARARLTTLDSCSRIRGSAIICPTGRTPNQETPSSVPGEHRNATET
jgi:hypothetical protein